MKGRELRNAVNEILIGKRVLGWVEYDLHMNWLRLNGFVPMPIESMENSILMRFVKCSPSGEVEEEVSVTLSKP